MTSCVMFQIRVLFASPPDCVEFCVLPVAPVLGTVPLNQQASSSLYQLWFCQTTSVAFGIPLAQQEPLQRYQLPKQLVATIVSFQIQQVAALSILQSRQCPVTLSTQKPLQQEVTLTVPLMKMQVAAQGSNYSHAQQYWLEELLGSYQTQYPGTQVRLQLPFTYQTLLAQVSKAQIAIQ